MPLQNIPFWGDPEDAGTIDLTELEPDPWSTLLIVGQRLPGLTKVNGNRRADLDEKKPKGAKGGYIEDAGEHLVQFDVEHTIWTAVQWQGFLELFSVLLPKKAGAQKPPVQVEHPAIQFHGVSKVVLEEVNTPEIDGGLGVVKFKLREWVAKPKAVAKAKPKPKLATYNDGGYDSRQAEMTRDPEKTVRESRWSDPVMVTDFHATDKKRI